jgi:hypothetical protein
MMPRDFTVLPGQSISVVIEAYNSRNGQTVTLDLAETALDMPLVRKARPISMTTLQ